MKSRTRTKSSQSKYQVKQLGKKRSNNVLETTAIQFLLKIHYCIPIEDCFVIRMYNILPSMPFYVLNLRLTSRNKYHRKYEYIQHVWKCTTDKDNQNKSMKNTRNDQVNHIAYSSNHCRTPVRCCALLQFTWKN